MTATKKKLTVKKKQSTKKSSSVHKVTAKAWKNSEIKKSVKKVQLPSPITPLLAIISVIFTYVAFALAIDSGSYFHYIAGFYFVYQAVRLTRLTIKTRRDDKARRTK